jgi:hypothetical protein
LSGLLTLILIVLVFSGFAKLCAMVLDGLHSKIWQRAVPVTENPHRADPEMVPSSIKMVVPKSREVEEYEQQIQEYGDELSSADWDDFLPS